MTRNFFSTLVLWIVCSFLVFFCFVVAASAQELKARPAHIGFIYPISTNGMEALRHTNNFSFHVLAGVSYQENAFCLSGISSVVKHDAHGVMISGISNHVSHNADGVQVAGVLNQVKEDAHGVQVAGIANITGSADGAQIAGLTNITRDASGVQLAGFANKARNADGQIAGLTNITRDASGVQLAGFANKARNADAQIAGFANVAQRTDAVQVAGFINVAKDAKTQVAGFINIAKKVSGVQVAGLINIAEDSKYPIGLINIIKNGEKQIGISADETGSTLLTFRSGGKVLYGLIGAGYNFKDDNARYVLEGGMGAHFALTRSFRTNLEVVSIVMSDLQYDVYMKSAVRLLAAYKIANRVELFAGPTFNYLNYERGQADIRNDHYLWRERDRNHVNGLYFGFMGGIQINL